MAPSRPMSPQELFELIQRYASQPVTTVCRLHLAEPGTPCPDSKYFCGNESQKPAINFDAVKEHYCREHSLGNPLSSVEAVLCKDDVFLFVEIKSWQNFERYQIKATDSPEEIKRKTEEKALEFNLKGKIDDSMTICRDIARDKTRDKDALDGMRLIYVLLTDVATVVDPMLKFRARMGLLSYTATNVTYYTSASMKALEQVKKSVTVRYKYCQNFDRFFDSL